MCSNYLVLPAFLLTCRAGKLTSAVLCVHLPRTHVPSSISISDPQLQLESTKSGQLVCDILLILRPLLVKLLGQSLHFKLVRLLLHLHLAHDIIEDVKAEEPLLVAHLTLVLDLGGSEVIPVLATRLLDFLLVLILLEGVVGDPNVVNRLSVLSEAVSLCLQVHSCVVGGRVR